MQTRPAAFIDRDGVILEFVNYLRREDQVKLRPQSGKAIRRLNDVGFWVVVVTNQPAIAKGLLDLAELDRIHRRMADLLMTEGAGKIDRIYFCPHSGVEGCECRKPKAGMIERAVAEMPIDLERSVMIGDTWKDVLCGQTLRLKTFGVRGGLDFDYGNPPQRIVPDRFVNSLFEAVEALGLS